MKALWERGFSVAGLDRSRSMIIQSRKMGLETAVVADVVAMPFKTGWDAILCLYDVMLYQNLESVVALAGDVYNLLRPGGLFIFDSVTESLVLDYWKRFSERGRVNGWSYKRQSWYERRQRIQHTQIKMMHWQTGHRWSEHHCQKIYELETLAEAMLATGFVQVGLFHEMTLMPGSEASGRVHFVYRREET
jgi:SAM-dependent methyltransferase